MDLYFQYAHNSHNESETKSNVSTSEALDAFDQFDWEREVKKANEIQKCSPTLTILINGQSEMMWVSGFSEKGSIGFVSECYFPGEVSKWFGLSKSLGIVNLHTRSLSQAQAREAIQLMVAKNYDGLRTLYV